MVWIAIMACGAHSCESSEHCSFDIIPSNGVDYNCIFVCLKNGSVMHERWVPHATCRAHASCERSNHGMWSPLMWEQWVLLLRYLPLQMVWIVIMACGAHLCESSEHCSFDIIPSNGVDYNCMIVCLKNGSVMHERWVPHATCRAHASCERSKHYL